MLLAEALFTFALVFLTLNVATTRTHAGNQYFGLVIGFTVLAGLLTVGPVASSSSIPQSCSASGFWSGRFRVRCAGDSGDGHRSLARGDALQTRAWNP